MKPLSLRAPALETRGLPDSPGSNVFRANALSSNRAASAQDAALVTSAQDCTQAISLGYQTALLRAEAETGSDALERFRCFVRLPKDLGYVEDGDVLGFAGSAGRARVLYRRASKSPSEKSG